MNISNSEFAQMHCSRLKILADNGCTITPFACHRDRLALAIDSKFGALLPQKMGPQHAFENVELECSTQHVCL